LSVSKEKKTVNTVNGIKLLTEMILVVLTMVNVPIIMVWNT